MHTAYQGRLWVHYGQAYVDSREDVGDDGMGAAFGDQHNGPVGASEPGFLFLRTGLHTGVVDFQVDVAATEPPIEAGWEEIVEVSFRPASDDVVLGSGLGRRRIRCR